MNNLLKIITDGEVESDKVIRDALSFDMDDKTGDPLIRKTYWEIKEPLKSLQKSQTIKMLEGEKERLKEVIEKIWKYRYGSMDEKQFKANLEHLLLFSLSDIINNLKKE